MRNQAHQESPTSTWHHVVKTTDKSGITNKMASIEIHSAARKLAAWDSIALEDGNELASKDFGAGRKRMSYTMAKEAW